MKIENQENTNSNVNQEKESILTRIKNRAFRVSFLSGLQTTIAVVSLIFWIAKITNEESLFLYTSNIGIGIIVVSIVILIIAIFQFLLWYKSRNIYELAAAASSVLAIIPFAVCLIIIINAMLYLNIIGEKRK